jgi:hypothetical protein
LNVYFHTPSVKKKVEKESPRRFSIIDLTKEIEVIDLTKGEAKLTSESITIFKEKKKTRKHFSKISKKMSEGIPFGRIAKVSKEEEEEKPHASGAATYASTFNYEDGDSSDEEHLHGEIKDKDEEFIKDEEKIRKAIAAVRMPFGDGHTKEENEDETESETDAAVRLKFLGIGKNPFDYLKDAEKKYQKISVGVGKSKIQDTINDVEKLKRRATKKANKEKWARQKISDLEGQFDDIIKVLNVMLGQATRASGALPEHAYKKFDTPKDLHVHELRVLAGESTKKVEDIPHDTILQVTHGEAHVNYEYVNSEGKEVKETKVQKDRQNLLIPRGASYSIKAPEDGGVSLSFISPVKY